MAKRTPRGNLPNAIAGGNWQRNATHHYWGEYVANPAATADTDVWYGLPNGPLSAISGDDYDRLETGDVAYVTPFNGAWTTPGGNVPGVFVPGVGYSWDGGLWICVSKGSSGGGDAVWQWLDVPSGSVQQVIRDAHVIVVAEENYLLALGAPLGTPPNAANNFNLSATGDVVGITCDYLDPGDGSELQLALSAASAGGVPIDVRLRPMELELDATTVGAGGFPVPTRCRLIGAGPYLSTLIGHSGSGGTTQTVVTLAKYARIEGVRVQSGGPAVGVAGAQLGVIECGSDFQVLDCTVELAVSLAVDRVQTIGIHCPSPVGTELVDNCTMLIDSLATQPTKAHSIAIKFGSSAASVTSNGMDSEVRNVEVTESTLNNGSASTAVEFENVSGGRSFNVEHFFAREPRGFRWFWSFTPGGPLATPVRGPKFIECRIEATDAETLGTDQGGFLIALIGTPNLAVGIVDSMIHDCVAYFAPNGNPAAIERTGFRLVNTATDGSDIRLTSIDNCRSLSSHRGFVIDASGGATGTIESVRMTACSAPAQTTGGATTARGCILRGSGLAADTVLKVGIHNCDFSSAPATATGLEIEDIGVEDTIVIGNHLTPNGGTAFTDVGTGTEAAHNIVL